MSDQENAPEENEEPQEHEEADVEGHRAANRGVLKPDDEPDVEGHRLQNRGVV